MQCGLILEAGLAMFVIFKQKMQVVGVESSQPVKPDGLRPVAYMFVFLIFASPLPSHAALKSYLNTCLSTLQRVNAKDSMSPSLLDETVAAVRNVRTAQLKIEAARSGDATGLFTGDLSPQQLSEAAARLAGIERFAKAESFDTKRKLILAAAIRGPEAINNFIETLEAESNAQANKTNINFICPLAFRMFGLIGGAVWSHYSFHLIVTPIVFVANMCDNLFLAAESYDINFSKHIESLKPANAPAWALLSEQVEIDFNLVKKTLFAQPVSEKEISNSLFARTRGFAERAADSVARGLGLDKEEKPETVKLAFDYLFIRTPEGLPVLYVIARIENADDAR